jgi:predicted unusual protein kinase regulating ubiquinone biosynthesis (AarF/ABC1/UbiB family)
VSVVRLAEEMAPQLPIELNFVNEAHNAERAAKFFHRRRDVVVSKPSRVYRTRGITTAP